MTVSELCSRRPEIVALLLSVPALLATALALGEQSLSRDLWLQSSETVPGKVAGSVEVIAGFVVAPFTLFSLLIYLLRLSFSDSQTQRSQWRLRAAWAVFACAVAAYGAFWGAVRRASLSF